MNAHEARQILASIRYKPKWEFSLVYSKETNCDTDYELKLLCWVQSSESIEPWIIPLFYSEPLLLPFLTRNSLIDFVKKCIVKMEQHEVDEWLKVDGVHVTHPHPKTVSALSLIQ